MTESRNETEKRVYSGLSKGDTVRFERWNPVSGRQKREGEIVEVNEDHPLCVWTKYQVEHESGRTWVNANEVTEVVARAQ